jgi:hypothetical protein
MSTPLGLNQVEAVFFATVKPTFGKKYKPNMGPVDCVKSIRVTNVTQKRPAKPDGVVVQLRLRFNEAAFMPLQPSAVIEIPDSMIAIAHDIEVEADDPNDAAAVAVAAAAGRALLSQ